jgi:hypothetical protein
MTARNLRPRKSVTYFSTKQFQRLFSEEEEYELELHIRRQANEDRKQASNLGRRYIPRLFKYDELPLFLQDNEFIRDGYRVFYSYPDLWKSVFRMHNETGNIWTHLLGFALCVALMVDEYRYYQQVFCLVSII